MARRPLVLLAALLFPLVSLTGCLGGEEGAPAAVDPNADNSTNTSSTELPTGRRFVAIEETNATEDGVGGMDHKHDYWHGEEHVVVYDEDVEPFFLPIGERDDTSKFFIGYVNLQTVPGDDERPALVYEGTGVVTFTITQAPSWSDTFEVVYRTAASDWLEPIDVRVGEPFVYEPEKIETDMPHSNRSLWNWKLYAKSPLPVTGDPAGWFDLSQSPIHVTISVTKARNVDDWPGHPDFYGGAAERIVVNEAQGQANIQHAADVLLYGVEPDQIVPEKLISMGTKYLDVYVNITHLQMPPGVEADGFTLFWRTAGHQPSDLGYNPGNNETDGKTWAYWRLTLDDNELDSPYQPESRFSFKVLANAANSEFARCYRCVPYQIEYVMTVIARPDPNAVPMEM